MENGSRCQRRRRDFFSLFKQFSALMNSSQQQRRGRWTEMRVMQSLQRRILILWKTSASGAARLDSTWLGRRWVFTVSGRKWLVNTEGAVITFPAANHLNQRFQSPLNLFQVSTWSGEAALLKLRRRNLSPVSPSFNGMFVFLLLTGLSSGYFFLHSKKCKN